MTDSDIRKQREAIWLKARKMPHGFVPSRESEKEYLGLLQQAAALGHAESMNKLGDYAFRRGTLVEAFYWKLMSELHGFMPSQPSLMEIRQAWVFRGYPTEYGNVSSAFTAEKGSFARTILRLRSGVDRVGARRRLKELVAANVAEARLYAEKHR